MLHIYVGDDVVGVRSKAHAFFESQGITDLERVTPETYQEGMFADLAHALSLFEVPAPVLLDSLSEHEEADAVIEEFLASFAESERIFVLIDGKPLAARAREYKKHAKTYEEVKASEKAERFNTFSLADALVRKDKKSLWVLLQRARQAGIAPEEIAGTLFWQLKSLRLAAQTKNADEAGMKDFTYRKAKSGLRQFKDGELEKLSASLITLYHEGHAGSDMELGLEKFILAL